jgi:hypothetical protein
MLLFAGEPAPYGKGMDTVYDEAVRRATQLAPDLVTPAPDWSKLLDNITRAAAKELGVDPVGNAIAVLSCHSISQLSLQIDFMQRRGRQLMPL